ILQIVDLMLNRLRVQMAEHEVTIELTDEAKDMLVEKGYDPAMGARPLRRAIQRLIEDPLADYVLGRSLEPGSTIVVARKNEEEVEISVVPPVPPAEPAGVAAGESAPGDAGEQRPPQRLLGTPPGTAPGHVRTREGFLRAAYSSIRTVDSKRQLRLQLDCP